MPSTPPVLLIDNIFDRINLYPYATLFASPSVTGTDVRYVADYRRERDYWQATDSSTPQYIGVDLGPNTVAPVDALWFDRAHNLWAQTLSVIGSDDQAGTVNVVQATLTVPVLGVVGGDPTSSYPATMSVSEEGTLYSLFDALAARRCWRIQTPIGIAPLITGVILGSRLQLASFATSLDEDAAGRKVNTRDSDAGWRASDRSYSYGTLQIPLEVIGAAEYDSQIRRARALLFDRNQPAAICMNYGRHPERMLLYQMDQSTWSAGTNKVYRKTTMQFRELGPRIR